MAHRITTFDGDLINVITRDDGRLGVEMSDAEGKLTGVLNVSAHNAINLGEILAAKGRFLLTQLNQREAQGSDGTAR